MLNEQDVRYIKHSYDQLLFYEYRNNPQETQDFIKNIQSEIVKPGTLLNFCSKNSKTKNDFSIYQGSGGYLYFYIRIYEFFKNINKEQINHFQYITQQIISDSEFHQIFDPEHYLQNAVIQFQALQKLLENTKDSNISYYISGSAIWMLGIKLSYYKRDFEKFKIYFYRMISYYDNITKLNQNYESELLYGIPGYLAVLIEFQQFYQILDNSIRQQKELSVLILDKGLINGTSLSVLAKDQSIKLPKYFRLHYEFGKKAYIGGAHGLLGVIQILLSAYNYNKELFNNKDNCQFTRVFLYTIQVSLETIINLQFPSGNFPSSFQNVQSDKLYQFCHGAPGAIAPLLLASKIYNNEKFLQSAQKAIQAIWKYGLLKKGSGLCHGISGNAYSFLTMYKHQQDLIYYQYAWKFILYKLDKQIIDEIQNYDFDSRYKVGSSDHPFSLFEGLAGDLISMIDFIDVNNSKFPGYEF